MDDLKNKLIYIIKNIGDSDVGKIKIDERALVLNNLNKKDIDEIVNIYNANEYVGVDSEVKGLRSFLWRLSYLNKEVCTDLRIRGKLLDVYEILFGVSKSDLDGMVSEYISYIKSDSFKGHFTSYLNDNNENILLSTGMDVFEKLKGKGMLPYFAYSLSFNNTFSHFDLVRYNSEKMCDILKIGLSERDVFSDKRNDIGGSIRAIDNEFGKSVQGGNIYSTLERFVGGKSVDSLKSLASEVLDDIHKENDEHKLSLKIFNRSLFNLNEVEKRYIEFLHKLNLGIKDKTLDNVMSFARVYGDRRGINFGKVIRNEKGEKFYKDLIFALTGYVESSDKNSIKAPLSLYNFPVSDFHMFVRFYENLSNDEINSKIEDYIIDMVNKTRMKDLHLRAIYNGPSTIILSGIDSRVVNFLIEEGLDLDKYLSRVVTLNVKTKEGVEDEYEKYKGLLFKIFDDLPYLKILGDRKREIVEILKSDRKRLIDDISRLLYYLRGVINKEDTVKFVYSVFGDAYGIEELIDMKTGYSDKEKEFIRNQRQLNNLTDDLSKSDINRMRGMEEFLFQLRRGDVTDTRLSDAYEELKLDISISNDYKKCLVVDSVGNKYIFNPSYFIKVDVEGNKKLIYKRIQDGSTIRPMLDFVESGFEMEDLGIDNRKLLYKIISESWYLR